MDWAVEVGVAVFPEGAGSCRLLAAAGAALPSGLNPGVAGSRAKYHPVGGERSGLKPDLESTATCHPSIRDLAKRCLMRDPPQEPKLLLKS